MEKIWFQTAAFRRNCSILEKYGGYGYPCRKTPDPPDCPVSKPQNRRPDRPENPSTGEHPLRQTFGLSGEAGAGYPGPESCEFGQCDFLTAVRHETVRGDSPQKPARRGAGRRVWSEIILPAAFPVRPASGKWSEPPWPSPVPPREAGWGRCAGGCRWGSCRRGRRHRRWSG